jgi:cytochrome c oxidase subunit II
MTAGALAILLAVVGLAIYAVLLRPEAHAPRAATLLVIGGGVVVPTIALTGLLTYGLALLPALLGPAAPGGPNIVVTGEQYWWRVQYRLVDGTTVELANEVRLPVGRATEFQLESRDVIHSFWIPALGGKIDMLPGHVNRLALEPTRTGRFEGVCAEYCGTSHAWMRFTAVVLADADFERWLAHQSEPAVPPADELAARGAESFVANGCGACHAIRGTAADGVIGPDLTHVGSRTSIGAGRSINARSELSNWIANTDELKPGVHMPAFRMLPAADVRALAAYLEGLE